MGVGLVVLSLLFALGVITSASVAEAAPAASIPLPKTDPQARLRRQIEERPNDASLYLKLASLQYKEKNYQDAAESLRALLLRHPKHKRGRYRLALYLRKLQRYQEAVELYKSLISDTPEAPNNYYGLGISLEQSGDPAGAIEAFEQYIRYEKRPGEERWIARAREQIERLRSSRVLRPDADQTESPEGQDVERAAADPAAAPVSPQRASADERFSAGDYPAALAQYQALIRQEPGALELIYRAGAAAALAGEHQIALGYAAKFLHDRPGSGAAQLLGILAFAQRARPDLLSVDTLQLALREGRFHDAVRFAGELERRQPGRAFIAHSLGRALLALGRLEEAQAALQEALKRGAPPAAALDLCEVALGQEDLLSARRALSLAQRRGLSVESPRFAAIKARIGSANGG